MDNQTAGADLDKLLNIGGQMANVMFNLAQRPGEPLTGDVVATMDKLRKEWDLARRAEPREPSVAADERALTNEKIVEALHSCGIDTFPSRYGFDALQVSSTSVPNLRRVIEKCAALASPAIDQPTELTGQPSGAICQPAAVASPAVSQMDGAAAEPVGEIVAGDAAHGWHMKALKPWDEIGEGTLLYAGSPSTAATTESTDHSEDVRDMVDWKANAECLLEEVKQYREIFKAAAMGEATTASASERDAALETAARICDEENEDCPHPAPRRCADMIRALKGRATAPSRDTDGYDATVKLLRATVDFQARKIAELEDLVQQGASQAPLPGCLADRLYEAISIARDRAEHAGSTPRIKKWEATAADLRAALARAPLPAQYLGCDDHEQ